MFFSCPLFLLHPTLNQEHKATLLPHHTLLWTTLIKQAFNDAERSARLSGVIKAFKQCHPLSLHMSALESVCKTPSGVHAPYVICLVPYLLCIHHSSQMQRRQHECWVHFNIQRNKRTFRTLRKEPTEEDKSRKVVRVLQWLGVLPRPMRFF